MPAGPGFGHATDRGALLGQTGKLEAGPCAGVMLRLVVQRWVLWRESARLSRVEGMSRVADPTGRADAAAAGPFRGSTLLLSGRALSLGVNFVTQVLIVRYLSTNDFGIWAYCLSLVTVGQTVVTLGLNKGASRFLAGFDEQQDYARLFGTLLLIASVTVSIGLAMLLVVIGLRETVLGAHVGGAATTTVLAVLILMAPVQALDELTENTLAVFSLAGRVFLRKYVAGPLLRLAAVSLVVSVGGDLSALAAAYTAAGVLGLMFYGFILWDALGRRGIRRRFELRRISIPFRQMFVFAVPLLSTDLLYASLAATDVIVLSWFGGAADVAAFRVVQPLVDVNLLVFASFSLLYMPTLSRLQVRGGGEAMARLHHQTAVWVATLSLPLLLVTTGLSHGLTTTLYGERYASSAPYLAILAVGSYVNVALGYNGSTLRFLGAGRFILVSNLALAVLNLVLNVALVPPLGALGCAIATTMTIVAHNVVKQVGLWRYGRIAPIGARYAGQYFRLGLAAAVVIATGWGLGLPVAAQCTVIVACLSVVLVMGRRVLEISTVFPELLALPLLGRFLR